MIKKTSRGFTLLETIVYLALFSLLMTSALLVTYQLLRSSRATTETLTNVADGAFVIQKFTAALAGSSTVSILSSTAFVVTPTESATVSPSTFSLQEGRWYLARGAAAAIPISPAAKTIEDVTIEYDGLKLTVTFYIESLPFRFTKYFYE